jgi:hypothetical protein
MAESLEQTAERLCAGTRWTVHQVKGDEIAFFDPVNKNYLMAIARVSSEYDWQRDTREQLKMSHRELQEEAAFTQRLLKHKVVRT